MGRRARVRYGDSDAGKAGRPPPPPLREVSILMIHPGCVTDGVGRAARLNSGGLTAPNARSGTTVATERACTVDRPPAGRLEQVGEVGVPSSGCPSANSRCTDPAGGRSPTPTPKSRKWPGSSPPRCPRLIFLNVRDPQGEARGLISGVLAAAHSGISILGVHPLPLELPPGRHRPVRMVAAYMFDVPLVRRLVGQFPQVPKHPA
jgi:hypothetical protein